MGTRCELALGLLLGITAAVSGCSGSNNSFGGVGAEFDVAGLTEDVFRLCETAECGDYSESECKFYLRYDILEYSRFSEDPDACFETYRAEIACLADAGSCDEEQCYAPGDACVFVSEPPEVDVPEAVQPTQVACEFRADCESGFFSEEYGRDASIASCQIEYVTRTELFLEDRGPPCAQAFIDFLVCIGESDTIECDPSGEDEEEACPVEVAAFVAECYEE
ncbi:MAG: hypothetical protein AAF997_02855 [Myxococcota bacterium]